MTRPADFDRRTILVVGSDSKVTATLGQALRGLGLFVLTARDGTNAAALVRSIVVHVSLLDVDAEGGGVALALFGAEPLAARVPVVLLGTGAQGEESEHPLVLHTLGRPFQVKDLADVILRALRRHSH